MQSAQEFHFSRSDVVALLNLSHRSLGCKNQDCFKSLVMDLSCLIHCDHAVCAMGNVPELVQIDGREPDVDVNDISYPPGYIDLYFENKCYLTDAVLFEFITNLSPVHWLEVDKRCGSKCPASVMASDFNIHDGWTYGTLDTQSMNCSVFFLGGPNVETGIRTEKIIEYIIPFYSEAYKRVLNSTIKSDYSLTIRETEVLNWVKDGKSSWEISMILNCSKRTIEFHIGNIKQKLNAANRAHAVAIGLQYGIIAL